MKYPSRRGCVARKVRNMRLMKAEADPDDIAFTERNGRYCVGCYSSETVEGLKRILAKVKARAK